MEKSNHLAHHGVKGMKWGVRRYQNKDGSLTADGKRRLEKDNRNSKKQKNADPDKWVEDDIRNTKRLVDSTSRLNSDLNRVNSNNIRNQPKKRADLSSMSDQELREKINREFLERQYNDLFTPQHVSKGREYTKRLLETSGNVLAITSSALGIALAIKQLKG